MRSLIILTLTIFTLTEACSQTGETPIETSILGSVAKITTPLDIDGRTSSGSGFFVALKVTDGIDTGIAHYLVTNKHMIGDWNPADKNFSYFHRYLDVQYRPRGIPLPDTLHPARVTLLENNGSLISDKVVLHTDSSVDIAIIFVNDIFSRDTNMLPPTLLDVSFLQPFDKIIEYGFNVGDQVFVLGYPLGIIQINTLLPIAKSGYISSVPGSTLGLDFPVEYRTGVVRNARIQGRIILVDGLIVHGNSGGPVILPSIIKTRYNSATGNYEKRTKATQNLVIGILSASLGPSGLSIVWSSDYITEMISINVRSRGWTPVVVQ